MRDLVPGIAGADPTAAGLLVECRANTEDGLDVSYPSTSFPLHYICVCMKQLVWSRMRCGTYLEIVVCCSDILTYE